MRPLSSVYHVTVTLRAETCKVKGFNSVREVLVLLHRGQKTALGSKPENTRQS